MSLRLTLFLSGFALLVLCGSCRADVRGDPVLASVGLARLHWGMSQASVRAIYPWLDAAAPADRAAPSGWSNVHSKTLRFAGCAFSVDTEFVADRLVSVGFDHRAGDRKRCFEAIVSQITKKLGPSAKAAQANGTLEWVNLTSAMSVGPWDPTIGIVSLENGSPYVRRQLIIRKKIPN